MPPPVTTLNLAPDVHATVLDDDLVFLDVLSDRYVCVPGLAADATLSADRRRLQVRELALAEELRSAGLAWSAVAPPPDLSVPLPPPATRSGLQSAYGRPHLSDLGHGAQALNDLAQRYRGRSFKQILTAARECGRRVATTRQDVLVDVEGFQRWIPYAPVSGKCLLRSFLLLRHLQRRGHDAVWVFGVRTWPFHAHCWLQSGDVVLDDHVERVSGFTPILAV